MSVLVRQASQVEPHSLQEKMYFVFIGRLCASCAFLCLPFAFGMDHSWVRLGSAVFVAVWTDYLPDLVDSCLSGKISIRS